MRFPNAVALAENACFCGVKRFLSPERNAEVGAWRMGWGPCTEGETVPSDRVGGAEDRIVDPHVVAQVGHVVAFALAVGVVLHAVERQVVQAHLIVAIAHQHLGDGARHEFGDGGRGRQLRGHRGGQEGESAGGEGVEVFAVDHGVDPAAQFHHVFVGLQNQEGPVDRHGDAHGGVEGAWLFVRWIPLFLALSFMLSAEEVPICFRDSFFKWHLGLPSEGAEA